ncbi:MAG: hypothetical protein PVJ75_11355 [Chloroflexota bacterium]|jgi:hypothetical protein
MKRHAAILITILLLALAMMLNTESAGAQSQAQESNQLAYLPCITRPLPQVTNIREPLLVDGEEGRIYAAAKVDGKLQTVVLATADGRYLDSYPYAGRLAVDRDHHWLLIDQGESGIVILDSLSGYYLGRIGLPGSGPPMADPQVDPGRGIAYAFRSHTVYALDVQRQRISGSHNLDVPLLVCGEQQGAAPISRSYYDLLSNTLYISFNTWVCTGFLSDTIHIVDAATWHKWGEYSTPSRYQAVPFAGNLYGLSHMTRLSLHAFWARGHTQTWYEESGSGNSISLAGNVVDWSRGLLYEAYREYKPGGDVDRLIRVSTTNNRQALATVSYNQKPYQDAQLVGHDPHTDQLYFLDEGSLMIVPTKSILPVD